MTSISNTSSTKRVQITRTAAGYKTDHDKALILKTLQHSDTVSSKSPYTTGSTIDGKTDSTKVSINGRSCSTNEAAKPKHSPIT